MNPKLFLHPEGDTGDNHEIVPPVDPNLPPVDPNLPPKTAPADDIASTLSKTFSTGLNEGKTRAFNEVIDRFTAMGVEIIKGADGKPDIAKTITTFKANATGSTDLLKQVQADYERQIGVERGQREDLERKLQQQSIQFQLSTSINRYDVVNRKGVLNLFAATYNLEDDGDGIVQVTNQDGTMVFDKTTGSKITLDAAVDLFLKQEPYLVKAQSREGVGETSRKGSPGPQISPDKIAERFYEEKDPIKKAALREQMLKAVAEGKR